MSPLTLPMAPIMLAIPFEALAPLVGDCCGSRLLGWALGAKVSSSAVCDWCSFDGDAIGVCPLPGELVGVLGRNGDVREEGLEDSGRRKGDVRGEPKERGEGL